MQSEHIRKIENMIEELKNIGIIDAYGNISPFINEKGFEIIKQFIKDVVIELNDPDDKEEMVEHTPGKPIDWTLSGNY